MSDPYDDYAEDVRHALAHARELAQARDRTALQAALDSLRGDLQDLRAAVQAAWGNAARFGLSHTDVAARQQFVEASAAEVQRLAQVLDEADHPPGHAAAGTKSKKVADPELDPALVSIDDHDGKPDNDVDQPMDELAQFELSHQDTLVSTQEETLGLLGGTLNALQRQAGQFGGELATQSELFDNFDFELDQTQSKLQRAMGRVDQLINHTNGRLGGWCVWLLIVALMFLLLVAILI